MVDAPARPAVLVLDDEKNIRQAIEIALGREGFRVLSAHDVRSALQILSETLVDALILDIRLGEIDGIAFFRRVRAEGIDAPAIFISGHATLTEAAAAVKVGGFDFIEKPFSADKLAVTVRRAVEMASLTQKVRLLEGKSQADGLIGDSKEMRRIVGEIAQVAKTNATVMIAGESGTGKELVANAIHSQSDRTAQPFIKVNCSAIPDSLIESELFGYEKGAFTGAVAAKRGLFEAAHRGTMFLDEVADLSMAAQAKILRVLQSGEIQKVGGEKMLHVDVRVLSGTHKDLAAAVREGAFREDLFYRLNVVPIRVPALRERADDIPLLVHFFLKRLSERNNVREKAVDDDALTELQRYEWPGNVRELQNMIERLLIMSGERITVDDLPEHLFVSTVSVDSTDGSMLRHAREGAEREVILSALKRHDGNVTLAAQELKTRRTYLHRRIRALAISKKDYF